MFTSKKKKRRDKFCYSCIMEYMHSENFKMRALLTVNNLELNQSSKLEKAFMKKASWKSIMLFIVAFM